MKETSVYAGSHTVEMKISDLQGQFAMYNLSVTVCDCSVTPSCQTGRVTVTQMGYGAIGIVFTSLIVLLCKRLFRFIEYLVSIWGLTEVSESSRSWLIRQQITGFISTNRLRMIMWLLVCICFLVSFPVVVCRHLLWKGAVHHSYRQLSRQPAPH